MPDIFLYPGEANPSDVKLRDPTTLGIGIPVTVAVDGLTATASINSAANGQAKSDAHLAVASSINVAANGQAKADAHLAVASSIAAKAVGQAQADAHLSVASSIVAKAVGAATADAHLAVAATIVGKGVGEAKADAHVSVAATINGRAVISFPIIVAAPHVEAASSIVGRAIGAALSNAALPVASSMNASATAAEAVTVGAELEAAATINASIPEEEVPAYDPGGWPAQLLTPIYRSRHAEIVCAPPLVAKSGIGGYAHTAGSIRVAAAFPALQAALEASAIPETVILDDEEQIATALLVMAHEYMMGNPSGLSGDGAL